jgi:hypothetical protein
MYRATYPVTVKAEDAVSACRTAILSANQTDTWTALKPEQRTDVSALAEGAGVDPWRFSPDGADTSVLPVPRLFSDVAMLAGYAATRSEDRVDQLAHHDQCHQRRWRVADRSRSDGAPVRHGTGNPRRS